MCYNIVFKIVLKISLKSFFAGILTSEIVMRKLALKIGMIPQKSECLASLLESHLIKIQSFPHCLKVQAYIQNDGSSTKIWEECST